MPIKITGPSLSDAGATARVGKWHKHAGDYVKAGELIVEVEESKAIFDVVAPEEGVLSETFHSEGDEVPSEAVLAQLDVTTHDEKRVGSASDPRPRENFDVVVIGAGPAGYSAAIRCAQLGLKTACIDSRVVEGKSALGGTCLNVGCIPSKALLDSSHKFHELSHGAKSHGIDADNLAIDVLRMMDRKEKIVSALNSGIQGLFKKHQVKSFTGIGRIVSAGEVEIQASNEVSALRIGSRFIVIASGSEPIRIPSAVIDDDCIVDSTGALNFSAIPKRLGVIGSGAIGLELGSVWNRLGSEVVVFEALDKFLPSVDAEIARDALREYRSQGLDIKLNTRVSATDRGTDGVTVHYTVGDQPHSLTVDKLIVSVGRRPCTHREELKAVGVDVDSAGFVVVDDRFETSLPGVYAIGDVTRGPMLAHRGAKEGVLLAEYLSGGSPDRPKHIPWVIYTWPEIAWIGRNEEQLRKEGIDFKAGIFPFRASGRALAAGEANGKVKVLVDKHSGRMLGAHLFGPHVSELVNEMVLAMESDTGSHDVMHAIHAHPTLSETLHEAALAAHGKAVHV